MQKTVADKQSLSIAYALDKIFQKVIEISFYALFFLTPLLMNQQNSEVFELPKMFFVWVIMEVIIYAWIIRMVIQGRIIFQRTFLDIPLIIFLISQFLSFLFSIDQHTSFGGYYSRFNGGLLSLVSYCLLYWAFVSNMDAKKTLFTIHLSLFAALLVALWGIPAHFGRDPSCLIFMYNSNFGFIENIKYNLNTDCWTAQFVPTVRIFSTLGQPNWLAAWLVAVLPLAGVLAARRWKKFIIPALLLLALFYTRSQSGFAGLAGAVVVFLAGVLIKQNVVRSAHILLLTTAVGIIGTTLLFVKFPTFTRSVNTCFSIMFSQNSPIEFTDITPSWQIRCIVWKGAIKIWQNHPLLGTGPETFAYSYYQFRPPEHNLTSEWDFLYNKAHNEYLNTLANTGVVGLTAYLILIIAMIVTFIRNFQFSRQKRGSPKAAIFNFQSNSNFKFIILALAAGWASILITNFFGFSVVPLQLLFFLFPAMAITLNHNLSPSTKPTAHNPPRPQSLRDSVAGGLPILNLLIIVAVLIATFYILYSTFQYYLADLHYSKAERLANQDEYLSALPEIRKAIDIRPTEPLYQNELSNILSSLILLLSPEEQETKLKIAKLAKEASDMSINTSPRNINFLRTRSTMFVRLSTVNDANFDRAARTLEEAIKIAPTDPKLFYNLGFLYLQTEKYEQARLYLSRALELRPSYQDPKLALEKLKDLNLDK